MDKCELCGSKFSFLNKEFKFNDNHVICSRCQNFMGFWSKQAEQQYKALPFEQVVKSYNEKKNVVTEHEEKEIDSTTIRTVSCPNCNNADLNYLGNDRKSFSIGKAIAGAALTGGIGTLAGFAGKKGDNHWQCKQCGHTFMTGK